MVLRVESSSLKGDVGKGKGGIGGKGKEGRGKGERGDRGKEGGGK